MKMIRLPQKPVLGLPAQGRELSNSSICCDNFGKRQTEWVEETSQASAVSIFFKIVYTSVVVFNLSRTMK